MEAEQTPQPSLMQQVDDVLGGQNDATLEAKVREFCEAKEQESKASERADTLKAEIMSAMDSLGTTSMKIAGRRIGITERTYYGVDREKLPEFQAWMQKVAPEANIPAAANVGKAVDAYLAENPSATMPDFIKSSVSRIFTNAKG